MFKKYLFIIFVLFFGLISKATHIIGGYMHYNKVGTDTYEISVTIYKDCKDYVNSSGTVITPIEFDNIFGQPPVFNNTPFALLTVYSDIGGSLDSNGFYFTEMEITDVDIIDPDSCRNVPDDICVKKGVYKVTVVLPDITDGGYYLSYQRCCRNPSSVNVNVNPNSTGISIAAFIPKYEVVLDNSNPSYNSNPPIAFCVNNDIEFDLSAYDDDGDSLAYVLATPLDGADNTTGGPNSVVPPPYGYIYYNAGYSDTYPIPSNPGIQLDPETGLLTGVPIQLGAYIVGFKVLEYRNSILISETIRDLRFYVLDCGENYAAFEVEDHICDGIDSIEFISYSSDVHSYLWDFGDASTTLDTSTSESPIYAYGNNGQFLVSFTTNLGSECEDIDTHTVNFRNSIDVEIEQVDYQCFEGNSFDFSIINYDFPSGTTLDWDFGPDASQATGSGFDVSGISYSSPGVYDVTVMATYKLCQTSSTIQVGIHPEIIVEIPDIMIGCIDESFTIKPNIIRPDYTYNWSLDGELVSTESSFQMSIDSITELNLELLVIDQYNCEHLITKSQWLHIKDKSIAEFEVSDTMIVAGDALSLTNLAMDYTYLHYDFGNGDTTIEENPIYTYEDEGIYTIAQTVDNGGECPDYYYHTITVRSDHYIYFPNVFTPNGDQLNDTFFPVRDGIKSYSLEIYDRWGQKVYNGIAQKSYHEWDGVYESGINGAQEVYNFFSTYVTEKEEIYSIQGTVLLLK